MRIGTDCAVLLRRWQEWRKL